MCTVREQSESEGERQSKRERGRGKDRERNYACILYTIITCNSCTSCSQEKARCWCGPGSQLVPHRRAVPHSGARALGSFTVLYTTHFTFHLDAPWLQIPCALGRVLISPWDLRNSICLSSMAHLSLSWTRRNRIRHGIRGSRNPSYTLRLTPL